MLLEIFMTVGELAAKAGVSVRTLQYYHKEGILVPSAQSEGGRRLYSNKDLVILQQIISLKYLGFSLGEIREQIIPLDSPKQVSAVLDNQRSLISKRIENLKGVLGAIEALQNDIVQSESVDFTRYANIVSAIHEKWDNFWMISKIDDKLANHALRTLDVQAGKEIGKKLQALLEKFVLLQERNASPESSQAQNAAKDWWEMVIDFTDGNMSLIPQLFKVYLSRHQFDLDWQMKWEKADGLIQEALRIYLDNNNISVAFPGQNREEE